VRDGRPAGAGLGRDHPRGRDRPEPSGAGRPVR
jgi:hypothetical protein